MVWKIIEEFPDYEVSDDGRIRTWRCKERRWYKPAPGRRSEPVQLCCSTDPRGYKHTSLRKPGNAKPYQRLVHRLIAQTFLPNPDGLPDVAHNDGNPSNNVVSNLRWSTHYDNQMDMRRHGTMQDGEKCVTRKLSAAAALDIRQRAQKRGMGIVLAREYGVSRAVVSMIKNGNIWVTLPD